MGVKQLGEFQAAVNTLNAQGPGLGDGLDEQIRTLQDAGGRVGQQFTRAQLGTGVADLTKQGLESADALKLVATSIKLAGAEGQSLTESSKLLLGNLRQFGLDGPEAAAAAAKFGDVFAKGSLLAASGAKELQQGLAVVGPIASRAGFSLEETTAILVGLDNKGLKASTIGAKAFRAVLLALASPTAVARKEIEELGVSTRNYDGSARDVRDSLNDLRKAAGVSGKSYDAATEATLRQADSCEESCHLVHRPPGPNERHSGCGRGIAEGGLRRRQGRKACQTLQLQRGKSPPAGHRSPAGCGPKELAAAIKSGDKRRIQAATQELATQQDRYNKQYDDFAKNGGQIAKTGQKETERLSKLVDELGIQYDRDAIALQKRADLVQQESEIALDLAQILVDFGMDQDALFGQRVDLAAQERASMDVFSEAVKALAAAAVQLPAPTATVAQTAPQVAPPALSTPLATGIDASRWAEPLQAGGQLAGQRFAEQVQAVLSRPFNITLDVNARLSGAMPKANVPTGSKTVTIHNNYDLKVENHGPEVDAQDLLNQLKRLASRDQAWTEDTC
ncbi:phage tail tape measure protein [Deinococcus sp. QL22]|uniref:phage tail tape measure protein n=1 Tax=Deinococcus sp. QL22 TaxID=2939437 RepID=UPI002017E1FD|nr:phage tail tape measure protein [Deinococcus sp. QL22]UQN04870.1 phage tail tape measure protein [Deinococcus sp. QL22]